MADERVILYKYMSTDYAIDTIKKQRLFLNDGKSFNDPFELTIAQKDSSLKYIEGLHILCLTGGFRKKLMWSHYADSHKGICITVSIPKKWVLPLFYTGTRIAFNTDIKKILLNTSRKLKYPYDTHKCLSNPYAKLSTSKMIACVKDQKWAYEKEYRLIFDESDTKDPAVNIQIDKGNFFLPVIIKNVYLGARFEDNPSHTKSSIIDACMSINATIKYMSLSSNEYSVKPIRKIKIKTTR